MFFVEFVGWFGFGLLFVVSLLVGLMGSCLGLGFCWVCCFG